MNLIPCPTQGGTNARVTRIGLPWADIGLCLRHGRAGNETGTDTNQPYYHKLKTPHRTLACAGPRSIWTTKAADDRLPPIETTQHATTMVWKRVDREQVTKRFQIEHESTRWLRRSHLNWQTLSGDSHFCQAVTAVTASKTCVSTCLTETCSPDAAPVAD